MEHLLRCPHHPEGDALIEGRECPTCGRVYPLRDGILDLYDAPDAEADQWDTQAESYDIRANDAVYMAGIEAVVKRIGHPTSVLDAGCGTGLSVRAYVNRQLPTVALDLSLASLQRLQRTLPKRHRVTLVRGTLTALPFRAGAFDTVLCANALQQLPSAELREQSLSELARVGQNRVVVSVHQHSRSKKRAGWPKEGQAGGHSGQVRYVYRYDLPEFRESCDAVFADVSVSGAGWPLWYRWKMSPMMHRIEAGLQQFGIATTSAHMLVAVGRPRHRGLQYGRRRQAVSAHG